MTEHDGFGAQGWADDLAECPDEVLLGRGADPAENAAERAGARRSYVVLAAGLCLVLLATALTNTGAGPWAYLVVAAAGTALSFIGAARMPRAQRRPWAIFAVTQLLYLTGDVIRTVYENVRGREPSPSAVDVFYLATYVAFALGIWMLVVGRRGDRDRASFLDTAIVTTGTTVIGVVFFVTPAFESSTGSTLDHVVAAAYPFCDILLLVLTFRLLTSGMVGNVALWAILGGVVPMLFADIYYDIAVLRDAPYPSWVDSGYLLSYVFLGFAPLHPSAHELAEPAPARGTRLTLARVSLLGVALLLGPATGLIAYVAGIRHAPWAVFIGGSISALLVVLRLWDLIRDLQQKAVQLAAIARRDGLTGVANRRTWDHELWRACEFAQEQEAPLTVAVLDMDHFKELNDSRGHLAGDAVLKDTAAAWAAILEDRGFVARYGGEEFTALFLRMTASQAHPYLERMRRAVTHGQTCSVGVATWDGVEPPPTLMSRADQALYEAKRAGRDRIAFHRNGIVAFGTQDARRGVVIEPPPVLASLRAVYQPVIDLATGDVVGAEALSRFEGQNPRAVFDTAAREGYAPELEAAAIQAALDGWNGEGRLAVNVSLSTLATPVVQDSLAGDLAGLVIEITETDMVDYGPEMMDAIEAARSRGAEIAIDDFGIGFSNVHRIATIQPDVVKLDMSLIRGIDKEPALQAVTTACVLFADLTGAKIVAEGIETEEERECVVRLGVHLGQGYLFGRPGPLPKMSEMSQVPVRAAQR